MVAGVGVVEDEDVQPRVLARVVVAAGAPVLPLPHLEARVTCHKLSRFTRRHVSRYLDTAPLLPHGLGVVEAPAALAVRLQREVAVLAWITRTLFIFIASLEPVSAFYSGDSSDMSGTTLLRMMGGGAQ